MTNSTNIQFVCEDFGRGCLTLFLSACLLFPFQNFFATFDVPVVLVLFHRFDWWEQLGGGFARGPLFYFNLQPIRQLSD